MREAGARQSDRCLYDSTPDICRRLNKQANYRRLNWPFITVTAPP